MARRSARRPRRASFAPRLVILAKSPLAGRAKRRLAKEIGETEALRFYRSCLAHGVLRLASDRRWHTLLAVSPDRAAASCWRFARTVPRLPQGGGDLGARMQRLFRRLPPGPIVIVASDIPSLQPSHVADAFKLLGGADAVLGPAPDGGFWLVGLRRSPRLLAPFSQVRWSTEHALADTLSNLDGRRVAFAATLSDVDSCDAYRAADGERRVTRTDRACRLILT